MALVEHFDDYSRVSLSGPWSMANDPNLWEQIDICCGGRCTPVLLDIARVESVEDVAELMLRVAVRRGVGKRIKVLEPNCADIIPLVPRG